MPSYSVSLPLETSDKYGFAQIEDFKILMKQNLKMLLLTNPGERVMNADFGVGLKRYLFELTDGNVIYNDKNKVFTTKQGLPFESDIEERVKKQMSKYLPYIIFSGLKTSIYNDQYLQIEIYYSLPIINSKDSFIYIDSGGNIIFDTNTLQDNRNINDYQNFNEIINMDKLSYGT